MKRLSFILFLLFPLALHAGFGMTIVDGPVVASSPACSEGEYLSIANFEEAGTPTGWSTVIDPQNGAISFDDTTSPVGRGSQQLRVYGGDATGDQTYGTRTISVSDGTTTYYHFKVRFSDATPGSNLNFFAPRSGTTNLATVAITTSGYLSVTPSGTTAATDNTHQITDGEWHHVWVSYTVGSGSDASCSVWLSNDKTKPVSALLTKGSGTSTLTPNNAKWPSYGPVNVDFDQVYIGDESIGDVCD